MKRLLSAIFVLLAASAFGAEGTHRYIVSMKPERGHAAREAKGVEFAGRDFQDLRYLDSFVANLTTAEVEQLRKDPSVRYVEDAELKYHAYDDDGTTSKNVTTESHPTNAQVTPYGITMVHAPDVWNVTRGEGINVAIVDTGIDYTHPELKDIYQGGYNAFTKTNDAKDDEGHGTHVSGIVAAANNNIGVVGVAPGVKLWGVKVLDSTGSGPLATIAVGLNWVISKKSEVGGNWIVNMSLGGPQPSAVLGDACSHLADAGVLVFAAAGNRAPDSINQVDPVGYPAAYSSVVAVAAIDSTGAIADFSNQGPEVALSGPGVAVFSTFPVGKGTNVFASKGATQYAADALTGSKLDSATGRFVYCGIGATAADFPASVRGNIALIQRGTVTFNQKTKNAAAAGASAVLIYNCSKTDSPATCGNDDYAAGWTLIGKLTDGVTDDPADLAFAWPLTVRVNNADGEAIHHDATAAITLANLADDYATESGTSMACPHAVGVAALTWSAAPNASATDVKNAMINTAHDLGPTGRDVAYGYGLVDALAAAQLLAPSKFGPVPGRRVTHRGH
jgi:serine protease